jgi:hypothetical protein
MYWANVGGSAPRATSPAAMLRELRCATPSDCSPRRLRGLTNTQIAERLVRSPRTVDTHVAEPAGHDRLRRADRAARLGRPGR